MSTKPALRRLALVLLKQNAIRGFYAETTKGGGR